MPNEEDNIEATVQGPGREVENKLSEEALSTIDLQARIERAKTLIRKGLGTSFLLDKVREDLFREALSLLSNIATE